MALARSLPLVVTAVAVLAAGCGGGGGGGDTNAKRSQELSTDAVFAKLPPGTAVVSRVRSAATTSRPAFQGAGSRGPSYRLWFKNGTPSLGTSATTATTPGTTTADVFAFVDRRARAAGWHAEPKGTLGVTDRWSKTYPDGAEATLALFWLRQEGYLLTGAVAAK